MIILYVYMFECGIYCLIVNVMCMVQKFYVFILVYYYYVVYQNWKGLIDFFGLWDIGDLLMFQGGVNIIVKDLYYI